MHKGMDFTAPIGTEIYATGDGIVEKVGWVGGYGRTIMINHGFGYKTRYAHCSKYKCRKGQKVKRGDLIGFVGNTGQSSGPHLHYEVIVNGKKINSQTLKLPSGKILKGSERKIFETNKIKLDVLKSEKIIGLN